MQNNKAEENIQHPDVTSAVEEVGKVGLMCTAGGNPEPGGHCGECVLVPINPKHLTTGLPYDPAIPLRQKRLQESWGAVLDTPGLRVSRRLHLSLDFWREFWMET